LKLHSNTLFLLEIVVATFQNISKVLSAFIHPLVKEKIVLYDKKESPELLEQVLEKN